MPWVHSKGILQTLPRHFSSPYVFCDLDGRPFKRIVKGFRHTCRRAEITDFRFHDLRHTFASHLVMQGIDVKTVKELLGHKTLAMTDRYTHLSKSFLQEAVEVLDHVFAPQTQNAVDTL